jgi:NAD(P)-dependent dehydrogenase (short-subunit alcohol dehydrogenase family)
MDSNQKIALNAMTRILAAELRRTNVLVNAMCFGWVRTDMGGPGAVRTNLRHDFRGIFRVLLAVLWPFMISSEEEAQTLRYLAATPIVVSLNGKFFFNQKEIQSSPVSCDVAAARSLWQGSLELAKLEEGSGDAIFSQRV